MQAKLFFIFNFVIWPNDNKNGPNIVQLLAAF